MQSLILWGGAGSAHPSVVLGGGICFLLTFFYVFPLEGRLTLRGRRGPEAGANGRHRPLWGLPLSFGRELIEPPLPCLRKHGPSPRLKAGEISEEVPPRATREALARVQSLRAPLLSSLTTRWDFSHLKGYRHRGGDMLARGSPCSSAFPPRLGLKCCLDFLLLMTSKTGMILPLSIMLQEFNRNRERILFAHISENFPPKSLHIATFHLPLRLNEST